MSKHPSDSCSVDVAAIAAAGSRTAIVSLPLPPVPVDVKVAGADSVQAIPLGEWPARLMANPKQTWPWPAEWVAAPKGFGNPPRRCLLYARFPDAAPDRFRVTVTTTPSAGPDPVGAPQDAFPVQVSAVPGKETYMKRELHPGLYHYVKREDSVTVRGFGHALTLRLGFRIGDETRYWQWCTTVPAWSGPLTTAMVVGGHIYAGPVDRPMTLEEGFHFYETPFVREDTISAKAFIVAHADGAIEVTVHFANVQGYGMGSAVAGLPIVELSGDEGGALREEIFRVSEGDAGLCEQGRLWRWMPVKDSRIYLGRREDRLTKKMEDQYVQDSDKLFVKGVGRSAQMTLHLAGGNQSPRRCLASPSWYKKCAEFGVALPEEETNDFEELRRLSDAAEPVFLRNVHPDGMSRGAIYRYLDELSGRHELSGDGNESSFVFRGAYMRASAELYRIAMDSAQHMADVFVDHDYFNVHYHGDEPDWKLFSLIYLRFGGLVQAWQETGDPWYLENAEAVANRWIAVNRMNQPRKNMGRDTEPVEGIMMLYEATGKEHYFQEAEKIALDVANSLDENNMWRCGFGVGPYWGTNALRGSAWNGTHLLAGIEEFLARAASETSPHYDYLLNKARAMVQRLLTLIKTEQKGFHRTSGAFLPRRYFLVAYMARDEELMKGIVEAVRLIEAEYRKSGEAFYKTGHHCAGYLEAPYLFRSLFGKPLPWRSR